MTTRARKPKDILDSALPINVDAEADLLSSLLIKPESMPAVLAAGIISTDFHDPYHRKVFAGAFALHCAGTPPESKLLTPWLHQHAAIDNPGLFLIELLKRQPTGTNAIHYANLVLDTGKRREIHRLSESMLIAANNGKSTEALISESRDQFDRIASRGELNEVQPITLGRLLDEHPRLRETTIDGLLRRGETMNLIAPAKRGKSWLSNHAALCFATGGQFLSTYQCRKGRVLLIDNELHKDTIAFRLRSVAEAMELQPKAYRLEIEVVALRGRLRDLPYVRGICSDTSAGILSQSCSIPCTARSQKASRKMRTATWRSNTT